MKTIVLGNGYIANAFDLPKVRPKDGTDKQEISDLISGYDCVINCIGRTGTPNVDWCEVNKHETYVSNVEVPLAIFDRCVKHNKQFVHISSGCMYTGYVEGGYKEIDQPNFDGCFYIRTKRMAEDLLPYPALILRIRLPFGNDNHPKNTVRKILGFKKVVATPNSMTYLPDFVAATLKLIDKQKTGIYHVVNPNIISPAEIALHGNSGGQPISADELDKLTLAPRSYCELNTDKLNMEGIGLVPVHLAIQAALAN